MLEAWKEQSRCKRNKIHFQKLKYKSQCRKKNGLSYHWFMNAIKWCIRLQNKIKQKAYLLDAGSMEKPK